MTKRLGERRGVPAKSGGRLGEGGGRSLTRTRATIPAALQARDAPFPAGPPRKARCTRDFSYLGLEAGKSRVSAKGSAVQRIAQMLPLHAQPGTLPAAAWPRPGFWRGFTRKCLRAKWCVNGEGDSDDFALASLFLRLFWNRKPAETRPGLEVSPKSRASISARVKQMLADSLLESGIIHPGALPKSEFGVHTGTYVPQHSYHFAHAVSTPQIFRAG